MQLRKPQIKLAIVDDHNLFRKGLITLINLADRNKYLVLFEAENGKDMISKLDRKALPDIVLLDIDMAGMDGFETVDWLRKHYPQIAVLVISMVETEDAVMRMVKLGVKGFLSKDIEVEDIHQALKAIAAKGFYYTDFLTGKLIGSLQDEKVASSDHEDAGEEDPLKIELNQNERRFLQLACSEKNYSEISDEMCLSPKTIDGYRAALFTRFNVKNRVGMVLFAIKHGLVTIK